MERICVQGGRPLRGAVSVSGCKNSALPILIATLLCEDACVIEGVPDISDVRLTLQMLRDMGCTVEEQAGGCVRIHTGHAMVPPRPDGRSGGMRASLYFLGACLGRFGHGQIGRVGGCDLGGRPIDQHAKAFAALGADLSVGAEGIAVCAAPLHGGHITFDLISVGATINAVLAAVRAPGETVLCNTATEPHVLDVISFLRCCGADIRLVPGGAIHIHGVAHLAGCRYRILPDMIEAGTYLLMGAATGGAVTVQGACPGHLAPLLHHLRQMGAVLEVGAEHISLRAPHRLHATAVTAAPHPGFPTDLQPPMAALLCLCQGEGEVRDRVFPDRFQYVVGLQNMGARIRITEGGIAVQGGRLHGATVQVPDLRGGAALLLAACAAEGESVLEDAACIARGYAHILHRLSSLGAVVRPC